MVEVCLIVCIGPDNVIGLKDKLLWHSVTDFNHFKSTTDSYPCLFGETTFYGLPKYPLKNRLNIVASDRLKQSTIDVNENGGFIFVPSIAEGIQFANNYRRMFICGGKSIYKYCLENDLIDKLYLTFIDSPQIREDIKAANPDELVRFPIDVHGEFNKNWVKYDILHKKDPKDKDLSLSFQMWTKKE